MAKRRSIVIEGFAHGAQPIPAASRVGNIVMTGGVHGIDPATGKLVFSFHSFVVKPGRHNILIDACIGNDKHRRAPIFHKMQTTFLDDLAYMGFPAQHRTKLHSTNPLERLNGEIKRRSEVVGIFPNEDAVTRLIGALLLEQNDEWVVQRARYMSLETIAPLSDAPIVTLPTMAA